MVKVIIFAFILIGFSNECFSQKVNYTPEIEAKVWANKKAGLDGFEGIYLNYKFEIFGVNNTNEANKLDLFLMRDYPTEIVSSVTKLNGEISVCEIQTFGFVSAERLKEILHVRHMEFEKFEKEFTINKIVVPESRLTEIKKYEITQSEFDKLPEQKRQDVLNNPDKFVITK